MEFKLRHFSYLSNAQNLENILSDAVVAKPIGFPYGERKANLEVEIERYIDDCRVLYEVVANGEVVGFVGFCQPNERDVFRLTKLEEFRGNQDFCEILSETCLEVSFALRSDYIGKGLGTRAVNAAINQIFKYHKCACITAFYGIFRDTGENTRSKNLMQRLGFVPFATYSHLPLASGDEVGAQVCYLLNPLLKQKIEGRGLEEFNFGARQI